MSMTLTILRTPALNFTAIPRHHLSYQLFPMEDSRSKVRGQPPTSLTLSQWQELGKKQLRGWYKPLSRDFPREELSYHRYAMNSGFKFNTSLSFLPFDLLYLALPYLLPRKQPLLPTPFRLYQADSPPNQKFFPRPWEPKISPPLTWRGKISNWIPRQPDK
jgi:hypothetical protein